jgi:hypothetical protein
MRPGMIGVGGTLDFDEHLLVVMGVEWWQVS